MGCHGDAERRELLRLQRLDVLVALGAAGLVNLSMLFIAASLFNRAGGPTVALIPLLLFTRRADIMGALVNRRVTTAVTAGIAALSITLNFFLLSRPSFRDSVVRVHV